MSFSDLQVKRLKSKLDRARVRTREQDGREVAYVEGWYAIAEANRIFGFDGWDRITLPHQLLYERKRTGGQTECAYLARVRIVVRAENHVIVREGSGFGSATRLDPGEAHDIALKTGETDATKRALATFGNRFGLALYDKEQAGVTKRRTNSGTSSPASRPGSSAPRPVPSGAAANTASPKLAFEGSRTSPPRTDWQTVKPVSIPDSDALQSAINYISAVRERVMRVISIDELDVCLTSARAEFDRLRAAYPDLRNRRGIHFCDLVVSIAELRADDLKRGSTSARLKSPSLRLRIDKSSLPFGITKRHRDKSHLARVAALPCLICGRKPSQAHHIRYAQDRGMGLKVSDEFVVPLCAIDHDALHRSGNEQKWWGDRNVDPLPIAHELWAASRAGANRANPSHDINSSAGAPPLEGPSGDGTACDSASDEPSSFISGFSPGPAYLNLVPCVSAIALVVHATWILIFGSTETQNLRLVETVVAVLTLNLLSATRGSRAKLLEGCKQQFRTISNAPQTLRNRLATPNKRESGGSDNRHCPFSMRHSLSGDHRYTYKGYASGTLGPFSIND